MTAVAALCADWTHAKKDKLIAALDALDLKTALAIYLFGAGGLTIFPPRERTVHSLLRKIATKDADFAADDEDDESCVASFMQHLLSKESPPSGHATAPAAAAPASNDDAAKKRKADAFAQTLYDALQQSLLTKVLTKDRLSGPLLEKIHDMLDRGTLAPDVYKLASNTGALASDEERRANVGGLEVSVATQKAAILSRNADFLAALWRFLRALLAAGMRPVKADASFPAAASKGNYGLVSVPDPKDNTKNVMIYWHVTLAFTETYFLAALHAANALDAKQLLAAHVKLFELIVDQLHEGYNLESAGMMVLGTHSFASALAMTSKTDTAASTNANDALRREVNDLKSQIGQIKRNEKSVTFSPSSADAGDKRGRDGDTKALMKKGLCIKFQTGECPETAEACKYKHACYKCGATTHGQSACTK